jgi:hypothetical protein
VARTPGEPFQCQCGQKLRRGIWIWPLARVGSTIDLLILRPPDGSCRRLVPLSVASSILLLTLELITAGYSRLQLDTPPRHAAHLWSLGLLGNNVVPPPPAAGHALRSDNQTSGVGRQYPDHEHGYDDGGGLTRLMSNQLRDPEEEGEAVVIASSPPWRSSPNPSVFFPTTGATSQLRLVRRQRDGQWSLRYWMARPRSRGVVNFVPEISGYSSFSVPRRYK